MVWEKLSNTAASKMRIYLVPWGSHSSFEDLKEELPAIITRCVDIKRMVVENDQFDTGKRSY